HMQALTADGVLSDIDAALGHLAEAGIRPERTGVVGFCMGGTIALVTAARRDVGAAVTFYGGGVTEGRFGFPPLVDEAARLRAAGSGRLSPAGTPAFESRGRIWHGHVTSRRRRWRWRWPPCWPAVVARRPTT